MAAKRVDKYFFYVYMLNRSNYFDCIKEKILEHKYSFITYNPDILNGKPVISGTRISVEFIMELIASGATVADIAQEYPFLPVEGIREAVMYAADSVKNEILITAKITA